MGSAAAVSAQNLAGLVLAVTDHVVAMLNRYPYNNGHLLIVPYRHTPSLASQTTPNENPRSRSSGTRRLRPRLRRSLNHPRQ